MHRARQQDTVGKSRLISRGSLGESVEINGVLKISAGAMHVFCLVS